MKTLHILIFVFIISLVLSCSKKETTENTINAIIGDISYISEFKQLPNEKSDENTRIITHLKYVEAKLKAQSVAHLSEEQRTNRSLMLRLLKDYYEASIFPVNYDFLEERKPCFIDKDGRTCAVGYLIEKTVGRALAEQINKKYKYEKLMAMNEPELNQWVEKSGFSKIELAMIQPAYGAPPPINYNYIPPSYGAFSAVLGGANLTFNALNMSQIKDPSLYRSSYLPIMSMFSGAGSIALGVYHWPNEQMYGNNLYYQTNENQKLLSMANIAIGTSTLILAIWNEASGNKRNKNKPVSLNTFQQLTPDNQMTYGLSLSRRF
jgi:hypothetical protein